MQVAQQLGFRSRRRPAGYWDNEDNLDREIAQFVAANWTQMEHPQSEGSYWYNQVSAQSPAAFIHWREPHLDHIWADDAHSVLA